MKPGDWSTQIVEFYLGTRTLDGLMQAAKTPEQKCEAAFYNGQLLMLQGDKSGAVAFLETTTKTCPKDFIEYAGAMGELKRMRR